jgi:asparagine synthase (glutamine-hydrolysing)
VCGIAGWVDWSRDLREQGPVVAAMTATMRNRGPDAGGVWLSQHAALGHRRLAVIDLTGGVQPMSAARPDAPDRTAVLTYSGELYNFTELRTELRSRGHAFTTASDTEVVLRAYLEWGTGCLARFNGIFAFAIWDEHERRLLLARDHLGVKPLYYARYRDGLVFGSEPKALLANPLVEAELDEEGLGLLFAMFGTHEPGRSPLRGIQEVRAGTAVVVTDTGVRESTYWQLSALPHTDDEQTTVDTVRQLLADTVRRQLVADVPLCALVSGGLDSSAITALAAGHTASTGTEVRTFTVDFERSAEDFVASDMRPDLDGPYARELVAHLGTRHTDVVLATPDLLRAQGAATRARDLPSLGDLDVSLHLLFAAIQGRSTVALSGESADEVFGGYHWFHDPAAVGRPMFPWAPPGTGFGDVLAPRLKRAVRPAEFLGDRYRAALAEVPTLDGESAAEHRHRVVSYLALTRFLPVLLDRKDRMSMAVGLEVRVPFCDHRLVQYVWNVPWALKCLDGVPKGLLRRAVADLLPASLVNRRKSAYPSAVDPGYDLTLRTAVRTLLKDGAPAAALVDPDRVMALVDGTSTKPAWQQRMALAYLLQIDYWLRTYRVRVLAAG